MKQNTSWFRNYSKLRTNAIAWDILDYDQLHFNNKIYNKYGPKYFWDRYYFVNNKYYDEISQRQKLDNVAKIVDLEKHNQALLVNDIKDNEYSYAPKMVVPQSEYTLWQSLVPTKYYSDYAYRKQILDNYIRSLPDEKTQLKAIKLMCLNDLSKNYLAFLDLDINDLNPDQKVLFNDLLNYYNDIFLNDLRQKELLLLKADEAKKNAQKEEVNNKFDFLKSNNDDSLDAKATQIIKQLKDEKELFINHEDLDLIKAINNDTNVVNNESIENKIDDKLLDKNIDWNSNNINDLNKTTKKLNSEEIKNRINDISNMINKSLINNPYNIINNETINKTLNNNQVNLSSFNNFQSQNQQINQKQFSYNQYVKVPTIYNIESLIQARQQAEINNNQIVNQMIESTIYFNNQYANANVNYKPLVTNKFTNQENKQVVNEPVSPVHQDIFKTNKVQEQATIDPIQPISLQQVKQTNNQVHTTVSSIQKQTLSDPFATQNNITSNNQAEEQKVSLSSFIKNKNVSKPVVRNVQVKSRFNSFVAKPVAVGIQNNAQPLNLNLFEEEKFNFTNNTNQQASKQPTKEIKNTKQQKTANKVDVEQKAKPRVRIPLTNLK